LSFQCLRRKRCCERCQTEKATQHKREETDLVAKHFNISWLERMERSTGRYIGHSFRLCQSVGFLPCSRGLARAPRLGEAAERPRGAGDSRNESRQLCQNIPWSTRQRPPARASRVWGPVQYDWGTQERSSSCLRWSSSVFAVVCQSGTILVFDPLPVSVTIGGVLKRTAPTVASTTSCTRAPVL
jgi:hypothetical protein